MVRKIIKHVQRFEPMELKMPSVFTDMNEPEIEYSDGGFGCGCIGFVFAGIGVLLGCAVTYMTVNNIGSKNLRFGLGILALSLVVGGLLVAAIDPATSEESVTVTKTGLKRWNWRELPFPMIKEATGFGS